MPIETGHGAIFPTGRQVLCVECKGCKQRAEFEENALGKFKRRKFACTKCGRKDPHTIWRWKLYTE